jgi:hypothetical protein
VIAASVPFPGSSCQVIQSVAEADECHAVPHRERIGLDWEVLDVAAVVLAHSKKFDTAVVVLKVLVSEPIVRLRLPVGFAKLFQRYPVVLVNVPEVGVPNAGVTKVRFVADSPLGRVVLSEGTPLPLVERTALFTGEAPAIAEDVPAL